MKNYGDNGYKADKGKIWRFTEVCETWASFKGKTGKFYDDNWVPTCFVEDGLVEEVDDPDWVTMPGYKVVYEHKGYEVSAGNPIVFHDREMAERYMRGWQKKPWLHDELYITNAVYEGKRSTPSREYNGKRVFNEDWWNYDAAEIGDLVEESIVDNAINCLPPVCVRGDCTQLGEASGTRIDENGKARNTYETFKRIVEGIWEYCGDCFRGENVMRGKEIAYVA